MEFISNPLFFCTPPTHKSDEREDIMSVSPSIAECYPRREVNNSMKRKREMIERILNTKVKHTRKDQDSNNKIMQWHFMTESNRNTVAEVCHEVRKIYTHIFVLFFFSIFFCFCFQTPCLTSIYLKKKSLFTELRTLAILCADLDSLVVSYLFPSSSLAEYTLYQDFLKKIIFFGSGKSLQCTFEWGACEIDFELTPEFYFEEEELLTEDFSVFLEKPREKLQFDEETIKCLETKKPLQLWLNGICSIYDGSYNSWEKFEQSHYLGKVSFEDFDGVYDALLVRNNNKTTSLGFGCQVCLFSSFSGISYNSFEFSMMK